MLDIKYIRDNPDKVKEAVSNRGDETDIDRLVELDDRRRELIAEVESKRAEQNTAGEKIASLPNGEEKQAAITEMRELKESLKSAEAQLTEILSEYEPLLLSVPNVPFDDVPVGPDESGNQVVRQVGKPREFTFKPKDHVELGEALGVIDSQTAAEVTGSRFVYLKGDLALMQYALARFAMSIITDRTVLAEIIRTAGLDIPDTPFVPVVPPLMIRPEVFARMARLEPKDERYHIPSDDLYLIGSAEHTLGPLHMDEVLRENDLPLRYAAFTPAFRREAGSYGKDIRGIIRQHQFDKLEMESFCLPESSRSEQDLFVAIQEYLLCQLGLPYQVVAICTGDMGDPDARQIDMECWMPGQGAYRETHTADLMTDYQARRLGTRVRRNDGDMQYVHMNDGTVVAVGRLLVAIMENYQRDDGTIEVPDVLIPLMDGKTVIGRVAGGTTA